MKSLKSSLVIFGTVGLLFLGACNKGEQASDQNSSPAPSPVASPSASPAPSAAPAATVKTDHPKESKGGQVVESGAYHLEFLTEKEDTGTQLELYLQKGDNHQPVPNAKVTAQVQLPNGKQQTLALKYDADDKYYTVLFPVKAAGQYPVKVTANINGEKVNGRFNFNQ